MTNFFIYCLGDVGEPGIGGGYRLAGAKGPIGMCVRLKKKKRKVLLS